MADEPVVRSADLMAHLLRDPTQLKAIEGNPSGVDALAERSKVMADMATRGGQRASALAEDRVVYRMTTMFLGGAVLVIALGIVIIRLAPLLILRDGTNPNAVAFQIPESLVAIASTAVGALAGLLSPLGSRSD
ncbi:MAG: hypothetical protein JWR08_1899 [Enterovirga sp.]|nr:hypothetical protein [Enterovirga sp.]